MFLVSLGTITLTKEDIWPDGDGPEHPTAVDVTRLMEECGGVFGVVLEWNLLQAIEVTDSHGNTRRIT